MKWKVALLFNICAMLFLGANIAWAKSTHHADQTTTQTENFTPPLDADGKVKVALAYRLLNIAEVNEEEQLFTAVGYLVAEWHDPRLAYTPSDTKEVYRIHQPDQLWLPILTFTNAVAPNESEDIVIHVYPDGHVDYFERSSAQLASELYLRKFPFDTQKFEIQIEPSINQENFVVLTAPTQHELGIINEATAFTASPGAYSVLEDWAAVNLSYEIENVVGYANVAVTKIDFVITMKRRVEFYLLKVFLPLALILILSWTVFWIDPTRLDSQVTISVTSVLTVIAYAFSISATIPKVPYLMFIDTFFLVNYIFIFSTMVVVDVVHGLLHKNHIEQANNVQIKARYAFPALFAVLMILLLIEYDLFL